MKQHSIRKSIPVQEIGAYLKAWEEKKTGYVSVEVLGQASGYDVHCAVFTDPTVPYEEKQCAMIIAQHSGVEISGMNSVLSLGNYLAAGKADDLLRKLVVVLLPCPNPWTFAKQSPDYTFKNEAGVDEYVSFNYHGAKPGGKNPAAVLVQELIDRFRPEILLDCHGVHAEKQLVIPSLGISAFASNRLYNEEILNEIQQAATEAGYTTMTSDMLETLLLADKACDDPDVIAHFRFTANGTVAPIYAYYRYHTMAGSLEIAYESEALVRLLRALEIGARKNKREIYAGYPVNCVTTSGHASLRAYGTTAGQRRDSRVELWQQRAHIGMGIAHPEVPGFASAIVVMDEKAGRDIVKAYYTPMQDVIRNLEASEGKDMQELLDVFDAQFESYASFSPAKGDYVVETKHGLTIRMGLPIADAKPTKVMINDRVLTPDEKDGYVLSECENWVFVDINVPAEKVAPVMITAVTYDCTEPQQGILTF